MAALAHTITLLVGTLRRWRGHDRRVVIEELADDSATTDLYHPRSTALWYLPMMTVPLAAMAALSLGISSAYADGGGQGPTMFTMIEAQLGAKAQGAPPIRVTPASGAVTYFYSTHPHSQGTWLFVPNDGGGSNN
jgi:hypothetical protein